MTDAISVSAPISGTDLTMSFEAGRLAQQADGSVLARIGDTVLIATATVTALAPSTRTRWPCRRIVPPSLTTRAAASKRMPLPSAES